MTIFRVIFFAQFILSTPPIGASVIVNQGFEAGAFSPWYQDRAFGDYRPWTIGSSTPHDGSYKAFCSGRIELRQDFTPVIGSGISELSFYGMHQLANPGNPWVELFYDDGTTSGQIEIVLDPTHSYEISHQRIWDRFDLLPYVHDDRYLSGISFTGIPDNTFSIDSVVLATIPGIVVIDSIYLWCIDAGMAAQKGVNKLLTELSMGLTNTIPTAPQPPDTPVDRCVGH